MPPAKCSGQKLLSNGTCLCAGLDNYFTAYCLTGCWEGGEGKGGSRGSRAGGQSPYHPRWRGEGAASGLCRSPLEREEGCRVEGGGDEAGKRMSSLLGLPLSSPGFFYYYICGVNIIVIIITIS